MNIYKTNKTDFTSEVIYSEINGDRRYGYFTKYLGLVNVHNYENVSEEEWLEEDTGYSWVLCDYKIGGRKTGRSE